MINSIKKIYNYIFYKFYRFFESGVFSAWWSDTKASIYMDILVLLILFPLIIYYKTYIDRYLDVDKIIPISIILIILIMSFNYYLFDYKDKWKNKIKEFNKLPKKKNRIGGWLILLLILLVFMNLILAFYLTSLVDWSQYRQFHSGGFKVFITDGSAAQDEANEMNQRNGGRAWTRPRIIPWGVK